MDTVIVKANLDGDYTNETLVKVGSAPFYEFDLINMCKYLHGLGYSNVISAYLAADWPSRVAGVTDNS